jgi:mono/diheme cytochrome c family protein
VRRSVPALAAASALIVSGCGGASTTKPRHGPALTAEQTRGRTLFVQSCAVCHTLADAGAKGIVGKNLDTTRPSASIVLKTLAVPPNNMPSGLLSGADARAVAAYVAAVAGR